MARDTARDYRELPKFAQGYIGKPTLQCIEDYAAKRKIVSNRAGKAFWSLVDDGEISVCKATNGLFYIGEKEIIEQTGRKSNNMSEPIAERILKLADIKGLSQADLARKAHVTQSQVSGWFLGKKTPSRPNMRKVAKVFGCNLTWLVSGSGDIFPTQEEPLFPEAHAAVSNPRRSILTVELEAADVFPPFPWIIQESHAGGRNPYFFVRIVSSTINDDDGLNSEISEIVSWGTKNSSELPALRAKAQFLILAAMHYNNRP